jgi:hypothetical protein
VSVRKLPYTKSLPPQSQIVTAKGKKVVRWTDGRGKRRQAEWTEERLWNR